MRSNTGFRSLQDSLFFKKLYQVSLSCKQALLFSRVQSSTDLLRSGSHELRETSYIIIKSHNSN